MPSVIGKHIEKMNKELYGLVENAVTASWKTSWHPHLLQDKNKLLTFLSSVNTFVAKTFIEALYQYQLLEKIKQDIEQLDNDISMTAWVKQKLSTLFNTSKNRLPDMEIDFLRQHLCNIRSNVLTELDVQFVDFFAMIQADIMIEEINN
jgi:hypothetical protein